MIDRIWLIARIDHTTGHTSYRAYTSFRGVTEGIKAVEREVKELKKKGHEALFQVWKTDQVPEWIPFEEDASADFEELALYEELTGIGNRIETLKQRIITNKGGHPDLPTVPLLQKVL